MSSPFSKDPLFEIDVRQWTSCDGIDHAMTHVSEPQEVSCFSRDSNRIITYGSRVQLCSFREPEKNVNLGDNIETYVSKSVNNAPVETIIEALQHCDYNIDEQADIITYRNNLNKIGGCPYNTRDEWELDCCLVNSKSVYLEVRHTGSNTFNEEHKRFMYYGYRFEALCTGTSHEPVNANSEFCSITRLRIANHRILLSSEIDCTMGHPKSLDKPTRSYAELKTMRVLRNDRDFANMYKYKFPKFWLQSYLAGVPRIALGLRTDSGELVDVKHLHTHNLHREASDFFTRTRWRGERWNPFVSVNFIDYVLNKIRRVCNENPGVTIRVRFDPGTRKITGLSLNPSDVDLSARVKRVLRS